MDRILHPILGEGKDENDCSLAEEGACNRAKKLWLRLRKRKAKR
jgi:hypothetical protein